MVAQTLRTTKLARITWTKSKVNEVNCNCIVKCTNKHAGSRRYLPIDVGDTHQNTHRHLHMTPKNMWRTSPLLCDNGIALPGGNAAKRQSDRQHGKHHGWRHSHVLTVTLSQTLNTTFQLITLSSNGKYAHQWLNTKTQTNTVWLWLPNADYENR